MARVSHLPVQDQVSIPFKRESVSKGCTMARPLFQDQKRFHSLQTGKRITRKLCPKSHRQRAKSFHSLQTGKRITSDALETAHRYNFEVSIPFKRESVSQVKPQRTRHLRLQRFHSLQTGKCISSQSIFGVKRHGSTLSFHSLQTGKCISRLWI